MSVEVQYYTLLDQTFEWLESFDGHCWRREDEGFRRQTDSNDPGVPQFVEFRKTASLTDEGRCHYLGKAWAGLYFLYTGLSDSQYNLPNDGNPLNFVGLREPCHRPKAVDPDECSYIHHEDVVSILAALQLFDRAELESRFEHRRMTDLKVYPRSWKEEDCEYLLRAHDELLDFVELCAREKFGILCWVCA